MNVMRGIFNCGGKKVTPETAVFTCRAFHKAKTSKRQVSLLRAIHRVYERDGRRLIDDGSLLLRKHVQRNVNPE